MTVEMKAVIQKRIYGALNTFSAERVGFGTVGLLHKIFFNFFGYQIEKRI
jgi:hypothetical protein